MWCQVVLYKFFSMIENKLQSHQLYFKEVILINIVFSFTFKCVLQKMNSETKKKSKNSTKNTDKDFFFFTKFLNWKKKSLNLKSFFLSSFVSQDCSICDWLLNSMCYIEQFTLTHNKNNHISLFAFSAPKTRKWVFLYKMRWYL